MGCGWVRYLGCGWVMVMDQRVRMKWVVGCGSAVEVVGWSLVVVRSWLKWIVGRGSASWVWIGGLGSVDGGFETVDLLIGGWIGWVDHQ